VSGKRRARDERAEDAYVDDIVKAAKEVRSFTHRVRKDEFVRNPLLVKAVVCDLLILGEAASKLSDAYKESKSEIPWRQIIDLRNTLVHQCWEIDLDLVWDVVRDDLMPLMTKLKSFK
jgi:uncharacterized protein with HEPN domain